MSKAGAARGRRFGILACGAYVPLHRLERSAIAAAIGWAVPGIKSLAKGARSFANWDEDSVTMSVEAARSCLAGRGRGAIRRAALATTTAPFADRSNCGIVVDALNLGEEIATEDRGGSRRAGSGLLLQSLRVEGAGGETLIAAADCRETRPGSTQEMTYGHGAAAILIGEGEPIAVLRGAASVHRDLVDQYRAVDADFDYALEERWVREEGYLKVVPIAVRRALTEAGIEAAQVDWFALAGPESAAVALQRQLGLEKSRMVDSLQGQIGDCGAAHPLLLLCAALESATPGQIILLVGFGQGADALLLEVTHGGDLQRKVLAEAIGAGRVGGDYLAFLVRRGTLQLDFGLRSERDNRTAQSTFYRKRDAVTGFVGGRCKSCNTLQFPRSLVCLKCSAEDSQVPESLAELNGTVKSYTEDWLAYTPCPPLLFGNVTFPGGANVLMEFTDFAAGELRVGLEVGMCFRIKDFDDRRRFRRYFWKPGSLIGAAGVH